MVNYAWSKRMRAKQYKRRHKPRRTLGKVNAGIRIRNDNMVEMKRLHRGSARMKYNYGNPEAKYPMNLRGIGRYTKKVMQGRGKRGNLRGRNEL